MTLPSFYSRMYHQRRTGVLYVRATPVSKNTLATKFPLILDGEYHPFVKSKPSVPCQFCILNEREMEDIFTRTEKINLDNN